MKKRGKEVRAFIIGMVFTLMISATVSAYPVVREIIFGVTVSLNGEVLHFDEDSQPFIMDGRTFLPVRAIADITGLYVDFVDGVVTLTSGAAIVLSPPPVQAVSPTPGVWHGNLFTSEYLGLTFAQPYTWTAESEPTGFDMVATSPLGASVQISHERVPPGTYVFELIAEMMRQSEEMGMEVSAATPAAHLGNYVWHTFQTTMTMEILEIELNVHGHYFINIQGDYARTILILSSDVSESVEEILAMFGS